MRFDILTLFPSLFESPLKVTILGRAISQGRIEVRVHDVRRYAADRHRTADDLPYGGGPGMVMKPEPIVAALEQVVEPGRKSRRIYFSPQGNPLRQKEISKYLEFDQIVLLCGRYEGVDERVIEHFIDEEVSIGDYVLTGGEFAALVFIDAVSRQVPGVVGSGESLGGETFSLEAEDGGMLLEYPQYTRPAEFRGFKVPEVLLSGDHGKIAAWRREEAIRRTRRKRPDLLKK